MSLTIAEIKAKIASKTAVFGDVFINKMGSTGTVMTQRTSEGKLQAQMTCIEPGCTTIHIRAISDWHQCYRCPEHSKRVKKAKTKATDTVAVEASLEEKRERMMAYATKIGVDLTK